MPKCIPASSQTKTLPIDREEVLKWDGWGYNDSKFSVSENGQVLFTGSRYEHSGAVLPCFRSWIQAKLGINLDTETATHAELMLDRIPEPRLNQSFISKLKTDCIKFSTESRHRLFRSHGHTLQEIWAIRTAQYGRIPDIVVWPASKIDVEKIVVAATECDIALIPYGGGTNVTLAVQCSETEHRTIASIDMCLMNRILWVDESNMTAEIEAGMVGQDIEKELNSRGLTLGHEPDSIEFSTLGGWISTRASGMKKNTYGNIEDIIVHITIITPRGVMAKSCMGPRLSTGPDIHHFVLGSEAMFGIITSAIVKIRQLPECKHYGSIAFPNFESGVKCLREIARKRCAPASIRLMDNEQFMLGQALKIGSNGWLNTFTETIKKIYIRSFQGFDLLKICAATLLFEGTINEVTAQEKQTYAIAKQFGGIPGGEENGRMGYLLTFMIAYLRDIALDYKIVGESFETSVPWDRVLTLCQNTIERIKNESVKQGITHSVLATCRVTQTYDAGACVYFYFAFNYTGVSDPVKVYEEIESAARNEVLSCGGSLSHHHGVGKIRKKWMVGAVGQVGIGAIRALKTYFDPANIFASNNILTTECLDTSGMQDIKF